MNELTVIIESPAGSRAKFDYDEGLAKFKLNKILPLGMNFPFDFGFIPNTKGEDGDPLDVMVISEIPTFTGCALDCRIIGCLQASQAEKDGTVTRNDRYIGIASETQVYESVGHLRELSKEVIGQVESFFINYNTEAGKEFRIVKRLNGAQAYKVIMQNMIRPK